MGNIKERGQYYIDSTKAELVGLGLDADNVIGTWVNSAESPEVAIKKNLKVLGALEKYRPRSTLVLTRTFGIRNFARYPEEILVAQFDQRLDVKRPYIVWVNPYHDSNGEFYRFGDQIQMLHTSLGNDVNLRFIECGSRPSFLQRLDRIRRRFNKAMGGVIGGHGTVNSIKFGVNEDLCTNDTFGPELQSLRDVFVDNTTLVLVSCSTGTEGGLAQHLSRALDVKVVAPKYVTSLDEIYLVTTEGRIDFSVRFLHDTISQYRRNGIRLRGDKGVYISGRLQAA